jgi:thiamine-phosphate pyrophosphorylase
MKCAKENLLLYAVTDRAWCGKRTLLEQVEEALQGGVTMVQLREKELPEAEFLAEAQTMRELCHKYHVPFIVNDNVKIALASKADGIHVGQEDMPASEVRKLVGPKMIIGVSAETLEEALKAEKDGADYLGVGAVFPTATKLDAEAVTVQTLQAITGAVQIPVCAIGGIKENNMPQLKNSGIDGVAIVSAIFASADITGTCKELKKVARALFVK